ncbi:flagellar biosynthesis protein FlhF [Aquincola tertiaricarbonis]|uniref:Flagellar biosynthesis protein FlhF n=1 Tax=Aquincola tertiaricarbonis TaxID=391953 RepID=A0ABY4S8E0_AQUTE|nr:flagellar biosynthesis protein FlhF [Aquincola tertiaricarbonis]URI07983.1 flagellar biosynthesis protein FlhF [Aquincola tertiaricarbonis]
MNVKRFTGRTSRDALNLVRQAFGDDAVVLSTRPCAEGVEVLAMAPDGLQQIERAASQAGTVRAPAVAPAPAPAARGHRDLREMARAETSRLEQRIAAREARIEERIEPRIDSRIDSEPAAEVERDVGRLGMSTLTFQDYVRERMLKRRKAELQPEAPTAEPPPVRATLGERPARTVRHELPNIEPRPEPPRRRRPPVLRDEIRQAQVPLEDELGAARDTQFEMMSELRSMKGLIEERFGALAFMERMQRNPRQANLTQKLLDCGFSPALIRKLADGLPGDALDETIWAASVLERNLMAAEHEPPVEDAGGVYAMIGSTGVGKTTTTAKIAAAFATKHGAGHLGLITLDAYRVGAHEQLRTYGRILGVPVHTAHDRASLEDLLDLLSGKKMVLIDTAGMAQRDSRTRELLDMVGHRAIQKLLVVNASAQGETIEDVMLSYQAKACRGVVLSKIDEAVKLGPALDALIRHKLRVVGVANGQRVPEDWHRLSAQALVQRAFKAAPAASWRMDANDVNLIFAGSNAARGNSAHA